MARPVRFRRPPQIDARAMVEDAALPFAGDTDYPSIVRLVNNTPLQELRFDLYITG